MITSSQIEVIKLLQAEQTSADRFNYERSRIHGKINSGLDFIQAYFEQYSVNGVRQLLIGMSTGVSECEHKLIRALTPEQSVRVNTAISNGMTGQALDAGNLDITDFESKLATLLLAGLSLYATPEAQTLGVTIASAFNLTAHPDGTVTAAEYPAPEPEE